MVLQPPDTRVNSMNAQLLGEGQVPDFVSGEIRTRQDLAGGNAYPLDFALPLERSEKGRRLIRRP